MAIQTSAGTTIGISATLPDSFDSVASTGYPSETYTVIGEVVEVPSFGSVYNLITHNPLGEREIVKRKGSINHGTITISFAADASDAGQTALKTAHSSDDEVAFHLTYPDGEDDYFTGLVMNWNIVPGSADSIKSGSVTIELTRAPVNVAAS